MQIEISDSKLEARIRKQIQSTPASSVEEVLLRLLETQEEQHRWLSEAAKRFSPRSDSASTNRGAAKEYRKTSWIALWQN
jgi:hypothetical protein